MPTDTPRLMVAKVSGNLAAILPLRSIRQQKGEEDELVDSASWRLDDFGERACLLRLCGDMIISEEELAGPASVETDPIISPLFQTPLSSPLGSVVCFFFLVLGSLNVKQ